MLFSISAEARRRTLLLFIAFSSVASVNAQSSGTDQQGLHAFVSLSGGDIDSIDLLTGKLNINIPLAKFPQKGGKLSLGWNLNYLSGTVDDDLSMYAGDPPIISQRWMNIDGGNMVISAPFAHTYFGSQGLGSILAGDGGKKPIWQLPNTGAGLSSDGSGYKVNHVNTYDGCPGIQQAIMISPEGIKEAHSACPGGASWFHTIEDPAGNKISGEYSANQPGIEVSWLDTLNRHIPAPGVMPQVGGLFSYASWPGWASTTDFSGCTGPLPIEQAIVWTVPGQGGSSVAYKFCGARITTHDYTLCPQGNGDICYQTRPIKLQSLVLPNGISAYTFEYDSAPTGSNAPAYGDLKRLTLPGGGQITYLWESYIAARGCIDDGIKNSMYNFSRRVVSRTLDPRDGSPLATWTYTHTNPWGATLESTVVRDPNGSETIHEFGAPTGAYRCSPIERATRTYAGTIGAQLPLKSTAIDYLAIWDGRANAFAATGIAPYRWTETLDDGSVSTKEKDYALVPTSMGSLPLPAVTSERSYFRNPGGSDSLIVKTDTQYEFQVNSSYAVANMLLLPQSISRTWQGSPNTDLRSFAYDESNGSPQSIVGNQTSAATRVSSIENAVVRTIYDSFGNPTDIQDPKGNTTHFTYDTQSFTIVQVAKPNTGVAHVEYPKYDATSGQLVSKVDENGSSASDHVHEARYVYDSMGILTDVYNPESGHINVDLAQYAVPVTVTTTTTAFPSADRVSVVRFDGFSRVIQSLDYVSSGVWTEVDTCYDLLGRVAYKSNPFVSSGIQSGSRICPGAAGVRPGTNFTYDTLGRLTSSIGPDGSGRAIEYKGLATSVKDEATTAGGIGGRQTISVSDVLGRTIRVCEVRSELVDAPTRACDISGFQANGAVTVIAYNSGELVGSVSQLGGTGEIARNRVLTYNDRGDLTAIESPETGTIEYSYDLNGNLLSKKDARGHSVSYEYDVLNRATVTKYDGTLVNQYTYDTRWWSDQSNVIGKMSAAWSATPTSHGQTVQLMYYDSAGRTTRVLEAFPSEWSTPYVHQTDFGYDGAGNVIDLIYPSGRHLTQTYDALGRLKSAYPYGDSAHPFLASVLYLPSGSPSTIEYGNGVTETLTQNARLQPCRSEVALGMTTLLRKHYFYGSNNLTGTECEPVTTNNGNIFAIMDSLNGSHSQMFTYDTLGRIKTWDAVEFGGALRQQKFRYDSFGNLVQASTYGPAAPAANPLTYPSTTPDPWPYDFHNRLPNSTFQCQPLGVAQAYPAPGGYDLSGNILCDGVQNESAKAFVWDADSRLVEVWKEQNNNAYAKTAVYSYRADGARVRADLDSGAKWREYASVNGQILGERDELGAWTDYIYAADKKIARIETFKPVIHLHGTQTAGAAGLCGTPWNVFGQPSTALPYQVAPGDVLIWEQKANHAISGVALGFGNNLYVGADGALPDGEWHRSTLSLGGWEHQTAIQLVIGPGNPNTPVGDYDAWLKNVVIQSTDGSIHPLFTGGIATGQVWGTCGNPNLSLAVERTAVDATTGTTYSIGDHLGTALLDLTAYGTPVWKSDLAPFGQELSDPKATTNRYKFTGMERDEESGLDYLGYRHYNSASGRFLQPDRLLIAKHRIEDPQLLNLYQYARNNPLTYTDRTGLDVKVDCGTDAGLCAEVIKDINNREGAAFQVEPDSQHPGLLKVVGTPNAASMSAAEAGLLKAINDTSNHAVIKVVKSDDKVQFGKFEGGGVNKIDSADLALVGKALGTKIRGYIIAHEIMEAYGSAVGQLGGTSAHRYANKFFPGASNPTEDVPIMGTNKSYQLWTLNGRTFGVTKQLTTPMALGGSYRPGNIIQIDRIKR